MSCVGGRGFTASFRYLLWKGSWNKWIYSELNGLSDGFNLVNAIFFAYLRWKRIIPIRVRFSTQIQPNSPISVKRCLFTNPSILISLQNWLQILQILKTMATRQEHILRRFYLYLIHNEFMLCSSTTFSHVVWNVYVYGYVWRKTWGGHSIDVEKIWTTFSPLSIHIMSVLFNYF